MDKNLKNLVAVLVAISGVGALGIPLGDPRFIPQALALEGCFIALTLLTAKNYRYVFIPNFVIAVIVIIGNSAFYKHIEIMTTFHPLYNALVLIIGGYVLQGLLLVTNYFAYKKQRHQTIKSS